VDLKKAPALKEKEAKPVGGGRQSKNSILKREKNSIVIHP